MGRPSSEPRDRNSVHGCRRPSGRCADCGRRTRYPELCLACIAALAKEGTK